jgi:hypothetical protein
MILLAALPALTLVFTWLALAQGNRWREAVIETAVVGGVLVAVSTEVLSLFVQLRFIPLVAFWSLAMIAAAIAAFRVAPWRRFWEPPRVTAITMLAGLPLAAILAATLLVALVAPPNTWDSMTYHLARVAHWVQQGSVADYPTETLRQLYQSPWAEYAVTHLQILSGDDHLANLVQWLAMAGSLVGVSLIARELQADAKGQYIATAVAVTLPMGILQSSSTQNDYVEALWLVSCVLFAMRLRARTTIASALGLGASLGLAILTKATGYVLAVPLAATVAWWLLRRDGLNAWLPGAAISAMFVILNAAFAWRSLHAFGSILGPPGLTYTNQLFTPQAVVSNLVRDVSAQAGTPWEAVNHFLSRGVSAVHRVLGISVLDPRTTWPGATFQVNQLKPDEDTVPDPIQFLAILGALVAGLVNYRRRPALGFYFAGLLVTFLLFAFVLRWQPWDSRLQLPLMVLAAPPTGVTIAQVKWPRATTLIAAVLFAAAIPFLNGPSIRPIFGQHSILVTSRRDQYFAARPEIENAYVESANNARASGCHVLGIDGGEDSWEYPLWVLLGDGYRVVPVRPAPVTKSLGALPAACAEFKAP